MKKSIIALMGLFTLVACSEDSYQEADKMNENGAVETGSGGMQNSVKTIDPSLNYSSRFDLAFPIDPTPMDIKNNSPYYIKLKPYFGVAYSDNNNDGIYATGWNMTTLFPNLYSVNNQEFGNVIQGADYWLTPGVSLNFNSGTAKVNGTTNPNSGFDISGVPGLTSSEYTILYELGKTYYFEYEVFTSMAGEPIHKGVVKQKFGDDNWDLNQIMTINSDWRPTGPLFNLQAQYGAELMYNIWTNEINISQHPGYPVLPSSEKFPNPSSGPYTISFDIDVNGSYLIIN